MSDDGQNKPRTVAEALAQSAEAPQEDATVQISSTELAAIRESASDPAMSPDVLREINRSRADQAPENDDPTQTFDRDSLKSALKQRPGAAADDAPVADDAQAAPQPADEFDDFDDFDDFDFEFDDIDGLGEFSDADLHAVVFGDNAPATPDEQASQLTVENPTSESQPPEDQPLDQNKSAIDLLDDEDFDQLEELTDDLSELVNDPSPPSQQPVAPAKTPQPAPIDDEALVEFRGAESRLLKVAAVIGGVAMILAGVLRFALSEGRRAVHPAVAGLLITVGFLLLMGVLVSSLKHRSH